MRNSEMMAKRVLERMNSYRLAQEKKRASAIRISAAALGVLVVSAATAAAVRYGLLNGTEPVPVDSQTSSYASQSNASDAVSDTVTSPGGDTISSDASPSDAQSDVQSSTPSDPVSSEKPPVSSIASDPVSDTQPDTEKLGANFYNATLHCGSAPSAASPGLVFGLNEDGRSYSIVDGSCTDKNVTIPGTYGGLAVTGIAEEAFSRMTQIESVSIPESVTTIAESAFLGCEALSDVYYTGSRELWSFVDTEYTILQRADSEGLVFEWDAYSGGYALVGIGDCIDDEEIVIPATFDQKPVKRIKNRAVSGSDSLRRLTIPEGVEIIDTYAIKDCKYLYWVSLPSTVRRFTGTPVSGCGSLHVGYAGTEEQYKAIAGDNSAAKKQIAALMFGEDGNKICPNYGGLSIKECEPTCTASGHTLYTCQNCGKKMDISHYDVAPPLGHNFVDGYCTRCGVGDPEHSETGVTWFYIISGDRATVYSYTGTDKEVTVPRELEGYPVTEVVFCFDDVVYYPDQPAGNNRVIEKLILPDTVTTIGSLAGLTSLKELVTAGTVTTLGTIPKHMQSFAVPESVTEILAGAFSECGLKSVVLPENLKTLGNKAFYNCTSLESVTIPSQIDVIGQSCFEGCTSLKTVTFGDGLKTISQRAFYGCSSIEELVLPNKVRTIGKYAFSRCTSLRKITFPASVAIVEGEYLDGCTSLETVVTSSTAAVKSNVFKNLDSLTTVYLADGMGAVNVNALSNLPNLEEVYIAKSVGVISMGAFTNCPKLRDVYYEGTQEEAANINYYLDDSRDLRDAQWHYEVAW